MNESTGTFEVKIKTTFGTSGADAITPQPMKELPKKVDKFFRKDK
jgi:hypothetical protein